MCGLDTDGKAYCWGDGFSGQLGFGGQDQQSEPIDVSGNTTYSAIAAGGKHTCAITSAGKGYCWGANDAGQATPPTGAWRQVSLGEQATCAVGVNGTTGCWGPAIEGAPPSVPLRQLAVSDAFLRRVFPNDVHHVAGLHYAIRDAIPERGRLLDLGCGANRDLEEYRTADREVWGVDFQIHPELCHLEWFRQLEKGGMIPFPDEAPQVRDVVRPTDRVADEPAAGSKHAGRFLHE